MRRLLQLVVVVACFALIAASLYNVLSDNAEVARLAQETACHDEKPCAAQATKVARTPFAQTFDFAVAKRAVSVRCARSLVFVGSYACAIR